MHCFGRPVPAQATQTQGKREKSVEFVPAAGPGQNATAAGPCQVSPPTLQRRQTLESTTDLESRSETRSRSSEQPDGSKSAGKECRQRHRERYPPPPGPPPSPTPTRRRREVSPTRCGGSRSPSCERSTGASEGEGDRRKDTVRFGCGVDGFIYDTPIDKTALVFCFVKRESQTSASPAELLLYGCQEKAVSVTLANTTPCVGL